MKTAPKLKEEHDKANHREFNVAFSESGKVLDPEEGLRRFLIKTRELIATDEQHFTEELFSDIFALYETGHLAAEAAHGSTKTLEDDPAMAGLAVASTAAAVYLLSSINSQRGAKASEYRRALKMFVSYEEDLHDEINGSTKEERRETAIGNLREKMRSSGLQFVNLPDEQKKFHKQEFREIAAQKGIGEPLTAGTVKRAGNFLRKPFQEKVAVTGTSLSWLMFQGERAAGFVGKVFTEYVKNPFRVHKIAHSTALGIREGSKLADDLNEQIKEGKTNTLPDSEEAKKQSKPLTLAQLHSVNLGSIAKIGFGWSDEEKDDLIKIMRDQEMHEQAAVRAKRSMYVQGGFMALQLALIPVKMLNEQQRDTIWMNVYSFFAPMGPLKGFADELRSERAKANSKLAEKAERLGNIMGIDADTLRSDEAYDEDKLYFDNDNDIDNDDHHDPPGGDEPGLH